MLTILWFTKYEFLGMLSMLFYEFNLSIQQCLQMNYLKLEHASLDKMWCVNNEKSLIE